MHFARLPHIYEMHQPLFVTFRLHSSPKYLQIPRIAQCVVDAIQQGAPNSYVLHAWVVMPDHVHLLITPRTDVPKMLQKLKGSSAHQANQLLGRTGMPFWQKESYDHLVRNSKEFDSIENYITQNPVQAGLVPSAEEYPWSSSSNLTPPWRRL